MPRVAKPLNDKQVNNAKPKEKAYTLADVSSEAQN